MIQITSTLRVKPEYRDQALALALEHVAASRKEPGCLRHEVFLHPEEPATFFFYERWRDREAIDHHFAQPYSRRLAECMREWAAEPPALCFTVLGDEHEQTLD